MGCQRSYEKPSPSSIDVVENVEANTPASAAATMRFAPAFSAAERLPPAWPGHTNDRAHAHAKAAMIP